MMKTVGIDLRCLPADGTEGAGVAHAVRFLISELVKCDVSWIWQVFLPNGAKMPVEFFSENIKFVYLPNATGSSLRKALHQNPCDILFVPSGACAPGIPIPQIPWVHDLAIFDHPEWFSESFFHRQISTRLFASGLKKAPIIFAVSQSTKTDVVRHLSIRPDQIIVTKEGGDPILEKMDHQSDATDVQSSPYCLAIGTIEPRKNFQMLVEIWSDIFTKTGRHLVIVGKKGWGDIEIASKDFVRTIENASDEEKRTVVSHADIVLVPSWFEGFGLVALEGMQAGSAVITSDRGALPEVIGLHGLAIPPDRSDLWKEKIIRLLMDDDIRQNLAKQGKERSKEFSWKKTAEVICGAIGSVVSDILVRE
ncbi:MAG: glycosyltransferase family 4 protein [bacterium]|nr:glycosyltransferase family 4 protein [bacterium]